MKKNLLLYFGLGLGAIIIFGLVYYIFFYHKPLSTSHLGVALNADNTAAAEKVNSAFIKDLDNRQIGVVQLFVNWGDIETKNGIYDWNVLDKEINSLYKAGKRISVDIMLIDGQNIGTVPEDFIYVDLYNQELIKRFNSFLQVFMQRYEHKVQYLEIGREVDRFLLEQPGQIDGFNIFFNRIAQGLKEKYPSIKVGTVISYDYGSQTGNLERLIKESLNINLDILTFTYYNINADYQNLSLANINTAFDAMLDYSEIAPLVILTGYSDKLQQAAFIERILDAAHNKLADLEFIAYTPLNDPSGQFCTTWAKQQLWGQYRFSPECYNRTIHEAPCSAEEILSANVKNLADWYCALGLRDAAENDAGGWENWRTTVSKYKF